MSTLPSITSFIQYIRIRYYTNQFTYYVYKNVNDKKPKIKTDNSHHHILSSWNYWHEMKEYDINTHKEIF